MAVLTVQRTSMAGLAVALVAASAGGDTFPNDGHTKLIINNASGAPITVTVNSRQACDQGFDHDEVNTVAAGAREEMGPFDPRRFGGTVSVTYSAAASVTVGAVGEPA
jgi:hypothetical protein